ncbi:MAG: hypothetical protein KDB27_36385 [Planctomycetales bacterium]|nr:hypothetical protein [Planctomycetales bacterium]
MNAFFVGGLFIFPYIASQLESLGIPLAVVNAAIAFVCCAGLGVYSERTRYWYQISAVDLTALEKRSAEEAPIRTKERVPLDRPIVRYGDMAIIVAASTAAAYAVTPELGVFGAVVASHGSVMLLCMIVSTIDRCIGKQYLHRGMQRMAEKRFDEAIADFTEARLASSKCIRDAVFARGKAYLEQGEFDRARSDLNEILATRETESAQNEVLPFIHEADRREFMRDFSDPVKAEEKWLERKAEIRRQAQEALQLILQ